MLVEDHITFVSLNPHKVFSMLKFLVNVNNVNVGDNITLDGYHILIFVQVIKAARQLPKHKNATRR